MAQHPNAALGDIAGALRQPGSWVTVYHDASMGTADPRGTAAARRRSVLDRLRAAGVPANHLTVVEDALGGTDGVPSPLTRYVLVRDGQVVCNLVTPGAPTGPELAEAGPIPHLLPLLSARPGEIVYLVVEAGRDGGDVSLYRSSQVAPQVTEQTQGRTDVIHKFGGGGWAHLRYLHHTEEIWKQNETELAAVVDRLVLEHRPRVLVVSGDVRARQLLIDRLAPASRDLVAQLNAHTRADGASEETLQNFVDAQLDRIATGDRDADLDRLRQELGRDGGSAEHGVGSLVHALRQAQVDVLFLDPAVLADRRLLALDGEPWVATAPEDAAPAGILGPVPAAEALARAAALTDANVRLVTGLDRSGAAALLRWSSAAPAGG